MAESFAHRWGQIIGNLFQEALRERLQEVADGHGLYLDYQRPRTARPGKKVTWKDRFGNKHELDYVLERGGTEEVLGLPAAFIETAWRRYTKHSKNKAQEIEGAVLALAETYSHLHPFLGIVLAGEFTKGSLEQLRSRGFQVLHFPYQTIIKAFLAAGINASFGEDTPETEFRKKIKQFAALSPAGRDKIKEGLLTSEGEQVRKFFRALDRSFSRAVQGVIVIVLHGIPKAWNTVAEAITYLQKYAAQSPPTAPVAKYEVGIRYTNGDVVNGVFQDKSEAVKFLQTFI